ncbi:endonuclease III [Streptobacillus moniliformis]|uniref:Endonuclease III n=1 Tax=Streptobacillus moniliformis (strain ATCC 14647 / DSM 12112 / NCTC 10651 / 9901) TaxID=519441 RepID=D1AXF4_STRM9|nr:endonuclease III [Streptobacillus moniliformis]ACZ00980.1 endonuclease III [Streptobacillus moniliformis DSM 12112]AVL42644.1 endonuclease III [Streptobacillus moniliformis]QXW65772.1 endonuclease III [Streptobacillus moniliformis]SQA13881.1 Endonuclease III [Streptobacillus moniliformis]
MTKKDRVKQVLEALRNKFKNPKIALNYNNEYQLMVAVILSAQCTDKRVNIVTEEFFKVIEKPEDMEKLSLEEVERYIKSTGFYKNKALNLKANAKILIEKYNGVLPRTMEELIKLPGVGRKTANVLLGDLWGIREGIVVDTHVRRLSNLIGFVDNDNVEIIERELMKIIPKKYWYEYSHFLILHGRDKCIARRPKCHECEIKHLCKYNEKNKEKE